MSTNDDRGTLSTDLTPRMVSVPAEALEAVLRPVEHHPGEPECRHCGSVGTLLHTPDCPVPILQAALSTPAPQAGEVGEVLGVLARRMGWDRMSLDELERLHDHDPLKQRRADLTAYITRLRALPAPQPEPLRAARDLLGELEWSGTHEVIGHWHTMGLTSPCCPVCRGVKPGEKVAKSGGMTDLEGHRPDCRLSALLAEAEAPGGEGT